MTFSSLRRFAKHVVIFPVILLLGCADEVILTDPEPLNDDSPAGDTLRIFRIDIDTGGDGIVDRNIEAVYQNGMHVGEVNRLNGDSAIDTQILYIYNEQRLAEARVDRGANDVIDIYITYDYHDNGLVKLRTDRNNPQARPVSTTEFFLNASGTAIDMSRFTTRDGSVTRSQFSYSGDNLTRIQHYDARNTLSTTTVFTYTDFGGLETRTFLNANGEVNSVWTYTYEAGACQVGVGLPPIGRQCLAR